MGLRDILQGVGRADAEATARSDASPAVTTLYECRHCGTTVSVDRERCPACERPEIAEYRLR